MVFHAMQCDDGLEGAVHLYYKTHGSGHCGRFFFFLSILLRFRGQRESDVIYAIGLHFRLFGSMVAWLLHEATQKRRDVLCTD